MNPEAIAKFSRRAALVGEALWEATVTIGGTSYPAEVPNPRERAVIEDGRELTEAEVTIRIRKELLGTVPASGSALTMGGRKWSVVSTRDSVLEGRWVIKVEPEN